MFRNLAALLKNKRFLLTLFLLVCVAGVFWSQSRYPELDHKLMMGAEIEVQAIGFDVLVEMPEEPTFVREVYVNTINWMWTNRKGMMFGLILGALMMNLLPFLNGLMLRSRIANSGLGILMGAPMGLCVNCSTPVAHGMHESGAKIETMLAAMISSPTLNVIVLTMLFAMFPPWLALLKIGTTLLFILAIIPLLTRLLKPDSSALNAVDLEIINASSKKNQLGAELSDTINDGCDKSGLNENWAKAAIWVIKAAFLNLWYLVKITVPLMILAGLLGAIIVTVVPLDKLVGSLPGGRIFSWVSMAVLALIGLFIPSPMTFDVIVAAILYNAGAPIKYVAILLFTLGIFSIYPFMTIWNRISRQVAFSVFGSLLILGIAFGVVANRYQIWDRIQQEKDLINPFIASAEPPKLNEIEREKQGVQASELLPLLNKDSLIPETYAKTDQVFVSRIPFRSPHPAQAETDTLMRRYQQEDFGITEHDNISRYKMALRYAMSRGLSSGDVNRDGWTDFAVTSDAGIALYLNRNGSRFVQQRIEISRFNNEFINAVALVDLNNDGWLDIWLSTLEKGNFVIYSKDGDFVAESMKPMQNLPEAATTVSPAFGDLDRDGRLDVIIGNVSYPGKVRLPYQNVRNVWLNQRDDNEFLMRKLPGPGGESLTTLLSDLDGDGKLDLLVGNDFAPPDAVYLGDGKGGLNLIKKSDGFIPKTTSFTMSIHSADLDNDLIPELFFGSISQRKNRGEKGISRKMTPQELCVGITNADKKSRCEKFHSFRDTTNSVVLRGEIRKCSRLQDQDDRDACIAYGIVQIATNRLKDKERCQLSAGWEYLEKACRARFDKKIKTSKEEKKEHIPQARNDNVLLKRNKSGGFEDKVKQFGLGRSGWTWNAKFADLDNDGWQDLYVANGYLGRLKTASNFFYKNRGGKGFDDITEESGLSLNLSTLSYTYVDIDNDGDLDIIAAPTVGPLSVFINQSKPKNSIAFVLNDKQGNFYGIGSRIVINYGDGKHQMREIQASGGYLSFDAPIAYFGLGNEKTIRSVEVFWSTGERSVIETEFKTGSRYTIIRPK